MASSSLYREIQAIYPHEPDWNALDDSVLIDLVEHHAGEPSCAALALGILSYRAHPRTGELACNLAEAAEVDPWLRRTALELLGRE